MKKKKTDSKAAPLPSAGSDEAARLSCSWLARHGLWVEEVTKVGVDGREWNAGMRIVCPDGRTIMNTGLERWDWDGSERTPRDEAWFRVVDWLFQSERGPSWVQETAASVPSQGWSRIRKRRFPVPKLSFSSLEEFVLKASVHPDFPSPDEEEVS